MEAYLPIVEYYYKGLQQTHSFTIDSAYDYDIDILAIICHNYFTQKIFEYNYGMTLKQSDVAFFQFLVNSITKERSAAAGVVLTITNLYCSLLYNDFEAAQCYMDKVIVLAEKVNCPALLTELLQYLGTYFGKRLKLYNKKLYMQVENLWKQQMKGCIKIRKSLHLDYAFAQYTEDEMFLISTLASEHTNAEIADMLGIKPSTVSKKLAQLYEKTGITSRKEYKKLFQQVFF